MPKFLELYGWRFFAVMYDLLNEPFHIHVTDKGKKECKYWVSPSGDRQIAFNKGFTQVELRKIEKAIIRHLAIIVEQYESHCKNSGINPSYKTLR